MNRSIRLLVGKSWTGLLSKFERGNFCNISTCHKYHHLISQRLASNLVTPPSNFSLSLQTKKFPLEVSSNMPHQSKREIHRRARKANKESKDILNQLDETDNEKRCTAFATAESYNFSVLKKSLQDRFQLTPVVVGKDFQVIHANLKDGGEAFFFNHGSIVCWGASYKDVNECLHAVSTSEVNPYKVLQESEDMDYKTDPQVEETGIDSETIIVGTYGKDKTTILNEKLALSNGLSRSAKLAVLERQIDEYISGTKHIPTTMQKGKKIPLTRQEVYQNIGELLNFRGHLNLHSELLEAPDFYWSEPDLERLYNIVSRVLDINIRISILNKKLDYANELVTLLREHLSEKHGFALEWSIIALICIEVLFEILHYMDRMGLIDPSKWIS